MDHTGLPLQTTPYLPLPCERSPDGATWTADIWFSLLLIYRPQKERERDIIIVNSSSECSLRGYWGQSCCRWQQMESVQHLADKPGWGIHLASSQVSWMCLERWRRRPGCSSQHHGRTQLQDSGTALVLPCPRSATFRMHEKLSVSYKIQHWHYTLYRVLLKCTQMKTAAS